MLPAPTRRTALGMQVKADAPLAMKTLMEDIAKRLRRMVVDIIDGGDSYRNERRRRIMNMVGFQQSSKNEQPGLQVIGRPARRALHCLLAYALGKRIRQSFVWAGQP